MDPITLILTALAAGAALGAKDTASTAVGDAYKALKALAKRRLTGSRDGELALTRFEQAPDTWRRPLAAEFATAGAGTDGELVASAQSLMGLVDAEGTRRGKYVIHIQGGRGVQVGDHNTQHNTFGISTDPTGGGL